MPGSVFLLVWLSYQRILRYKRIQIESRMAGGEISKSYSAAFGSQEQNPKETIQRLFKIHYGLGTYAVPILMNVLLASVATMCTLVYSGLDMGIPLDLENLIRRMPVSV